MTSTQCITSSTGESRPSTAVNVNDNPPATCFSGNLVYVDTTKPVTWLWPGRIPRGKLSMIYGDPGLSKSFLTIDIASRVTTGAGWPDQPGERFDPGDVILLSAEDDVADTIKPRLLAAGADCSRISAIEAVTMPDGHLRGLNLGEDLRHLDRLLEQRPDTRALVVDPISAYCGRTDSHTNAEVRGLLAPLGELAARHEVAVIAVSHMNKSGGGRALYRATGSLAFIAAARAGWLITEDPDDPDRRLMLCTKMNLAKQPDGLAYTLHESGVGCPCISWDANPVVVTADEVLARQAKPADDEAGSAREEAVGWLNEALADGPIAAKAVKRMATDTGLSWRTVRRAKDDIGVRVQRSGFGPGGEWTWSLAESHRCPTDPIDAIDALPSERDTYGDFGHLCSDDGDSDTLDFRLNGHVPGGAA